MSFISIGEAKNESGILFAGAGAGSGAGTFFNQYTYGGYGGGVSGGDGSHCTKYYGNLRCGTGATQTSYGTNYANSNNNGGKFYGGNCEARGYHEASGGGSGYYGGAGGDYYSAGGGGSSFINESFIKNGIIIPGNESMPSPYSFTERLIGNRGQGYVRITPIVINIEIFSPKRSCYYPDTNFTLDLILFTYNFNEVYNISRAVNSSGLQDYELIQTHQDDSQNYIFNDTFKVPSERGYYQISYFMFSESVPYYKIEDIILVNKVPEILLIGERVTVELAGISLGNVTFKCKYEDHDLYTSSEMVSSDSFVTGTIKIDIINFPISSQIHFDFYAIDELGTKSNIIQ